LEVDQLLWTLWAVRILMEKE